LNFISSFTPNLESSIRLLLEFFKILFGHVDLIQISELMFTLVHSYNMSLLDIENMIIWERDIYVTMLNSKLEKEKLKQEENKATQFRAGLYQ